MARSLPARTALRLAATFALALAASAAAGRAAQPTYFPDDPIAVDPETQDARQVREWDLSDLYDFVEHSFLGPGDKAPIRAVNVNTIDEVPDSSWFTNRAGTRPLTADEVRRGPDTTQGPAPGKWTVVSGKSDGITPGFTIRDTAGITWFIKFDPDSNPEMATGAEMVSTKLFWALGFHVPENHLAVLRRENLEIAPDATIRDIMGRRRRLTEDDVRQLLMRGRARTMARSAWWPVAPSRAGPSAPSATTARGPTIRTTSTCTSTVASCAACVPFRPGSTTTTRAASTRWTPSSSGTAARSCGIISSTSGPRSAAAASTRRRRAPATSTLGGAAHHHHRAHAGPLRAAVDPRALP